MPPRIESSEVHLSQDDSVDFQRTHTSVQSPECKLPLIVSKLYAVPFVVWIATVARAPKTSAPTALLLTKRR